MEETKFIVSIEKDTDGTYLAYNINGDGYQLCGRGNTIAEAKADFEASMAGVAESESERGNEVVAMLTATPEYRFSISSLFEYYSMLNVSAFARFLGINETLMRQYKSGKTYISDMQLKKIEDGIHRLGEEFTSLKLV